MSVPMSCVSLCQAVTMAVTEREAQDRESLCPVTTVVTCMSCQLTLSVKLTIGECDSE